MKKEPIYANINSINNTGIKTKQQEQAFANKNDNIGLSIVNNCKNFINYNTPVSSFTSTSANTSLCLFSKCQ